MNLTSPTQIKELLKKHETRPTKRFGQNFLINKGILDKIITVSNIKKEDIILEIGPGLGTLTKELAQNAKQIIVIEKDKKMAELLKEVLEKENITNVKIINEDALKLELEKSQIQNSKKQINSKFQKTITKQEILKSNILNLESNYKVVANIPYNITSALIRKFLESENKPTEMILMIQKEVAQRICEKKKMSLLSLSVQFYADPKILFFVSKGSFFPAPNVDSAIIKITPKKETPKNTDIFFKILKAGFSNPRKLLLSNLSINLKIEKDKLANIFSENNIKKNARAEDLSIEDWKKLSTIIT